MDLRIGNGFDVHALAPGLDLWIGGIKIEHHSGFVAHSDGDVLIHSLCDALLGALALGDIGKHFPDTDPRYKGISSTILLEKCMELVHSHGYSIINCDNTIMAEQPKLRPHIDSIRENLATILGIATDRVSVKATTTERLGFTGREEGIAVISSVILIKS